MSTSKSRSRSRLFSLSARIERRAEAAPKEVTGAHDDDGCLMCVAARGGGDVRSLFPGADGSAPAIPVPFLLEAGRKALAQYEPRPGEEVPLMQFGSMTRSGDMMTSSLSVDATGRIFWISSHERRLVAKLQAVEAAGQPS